MNQNNFAVRGEVWNRIYFILNRLVESTEVESMDIY